MEDELSEYVVLKLLATSDQSYHVGATYRRGGFGYLRRTINGWNAAAKGKAFAVLTDLDDAPCAGDLISEWLTSAANPNLIFRVAVREVEAWLLADSTGLAAFLRIAERFIPSNPDGILDPKDTLIKLAGLSRLKFIRDSVLPRRGSTAKQGPGYNESLGAFVRDMWDPRTASA
ncbi:MAG TPA: hypothetical protein VH024_06505, partial [Candidatus Angelobacter sp.]|nr:hypothetical protein [Candidatus Angelobacter sp.]